MVVHASRCAPVAASHQGVYPFERYQPWSVLRLRGFCGHSVDARLQRGNEGTRLVLRPGSLSDRRDAVKNLRHGAGTEDEHFRRRPDAVEGALHVGGSGIADGTGVLGQHQVGLGLVQHCSLNVKGAFPRSEQRAHGGLDLGATEHRSVNAAVANHRFLLRCGRVVTEVTDPNQLVAEAQGKHNLCPTRE